MYDGYRALEQLVADIGAPLAPIHATIKSDTYLALQHSIDHVAPPSSYLERSMVALTCATPMLEAALSCAAQTVTTPGLSHTAIQFSLYGNNSALMDHTGTACFSEEQRKSN